MKSSMTCKFIFNNYGFAVSALSVSCFGALPGLGGSRSGQDAGQAGMLLSTETGSGLGADIWGGFFALEGLARQRSLHRTGEKPGSALTSTLCFSTQGDAPGQEQSWPVPTPQRS